MGTRRFGRYRVETSNEDKLLFPGDGITKGALIAYYERVADRLLPHLRGRPLTLERYPDGIEGVGFYQKRAEAPLPPWMTTARVALRTREESQELVVCDNRASLAFLANRACITLHPWLSRVDTPDHPDMLVFDLDPSGSGFEAVRQAALRVRDLLESLGAPSFVKLTGSRGVHVVVPLDRKADFDAVRGFARDAASLLARRHPDLLTVEQRKQKRGERVYLDVARNAYGQTLVAPWSVRALPGAPVAAPIPWRALERGSVGPRDYTVPNLFRRVARRRDPWLGMGRRARSLAPLREGLRRIARDETGSDPGA